jgi:hypothetical protein
VQVKKWESFETRFAQTAKLSFPFSAPHKWQRLERIKFNSNNININIKNRRD